MQFSRPSGTPPGGNVTKVVALTFTGMVAGSQIAPYTSPPIDRVQSIGASGVLGTVAFSQQAGMADAALTKEVQNLTKAVQELVAGQSGQQPKGRDWLGLFAPAFIALLLAALGGLGLNNQIGRVDTRVAALETKVDSNYKDVRDKLDAILGRLPSIQKH
jgi:hypothetical protein